MPPRAEHLAAKDERELAGRWKVEKVEGLQDSSDDSSDGGGSKAVLSSGSAISHP